MESLVLSLYGKFKAKQNNSLIFAIEKIQGKSRANNSKLNLQNKMASAEMSLIEPLKLKYLFVGVDHWNKGGVIGGSGTILAARFRTIAVVSLSEFS
jgi:hypothetical protein